MKEVYYRAGLITALQLAMSGPFCLPHPVALSAFMICRGLCACTEMLWMCVLYVSFGALPWVVHSCLLLGPDCSYEQGASCFVWI